MVLESILKRFVGSIYQLLLDYSQISSPTLEMSKLQCEWCVRDPTL